MTTAELPTLVLLGPALTEEQAREIFRQGEEAVVFALLSLAKRLAEQQPSAAPVVTPTTPSAMVPSFLKPGAAGRRKRPGRKAGHPGARRPTPERVDRQVDHRLEHCPTCQGPLTRTQQTRTRITEDIPEQITPVVSEHTIHRDWCPRCQKAVEPVVTAALPGATVGNRTVVLSAWLHYGLGNTLSQIVAVFNHHLTLKLTPGGLVQMWYRLQAILFAWYLEIQAEALGSAVLHGDETGWRVNGKTHWLWCFTTTDLTYFMIDRSRGSPALAKFFQEEFAGTLVTDFWGAYNAVACARRQTCLVHLLRDLMTVERSQRPGPNWPAFAKKLRRLFGDAIRLKKREGVPAAEYASRRARLTVRLDELIATTWDDPQAKRLIKRLRRHRDDLLTFLDHADVPFDNNHAERAIRPAVMIRKNSYGNRSERGADAQAVLMSVSRTLQQRGHAPLKTVVEALNTYLATGKLPPLPAKTTPLG
ncbi:MAG: IS66 family transposase [Planctomycetaceae bacterium]|nr:IS66 family transposase [Planctomycetaceae bacterium]